MNSQAPTAGKIHQYNTNPCQFQKEQILEIDCMTSFQKELFTIPFFG